MRCIVEKCRPALQPIRSTSGHGGMKRCLYILLIGYLLTDCREVQPPEKAATVLSVDPTMCGLCGGWFVQIDSTRYRADIPATYAKPNNPVWLRYTPDQRAGFKELHWITVQTLRQR